MDSIGTKTPSITDSIQANSFDADINSATNITPLSGEQTGSLLSSVPWYAWLGLVLVVAFVAFNIFIYLTKGFDDISNFYTLIMEKISNFFGVSSNNTIQQTSSNPNPVGSTQGENVSTTTPANDSSQNTALYNALNTTQQQQTQKNESSEYTADDSHSTIQQTKSANKAGWCYIGEDRGFRSCIKVSEGDNCMSGNIFPSEDICVNPSLRV